MSRRRLVAAGAVLTVLAVAAPLPASARVPAGPGADAVHPRPPLVRREPGRAVPMPHVQPRGPRPVPLPEVRRWRRPVPMPQVGDPGTGVLLVPAPPRP